MSIDWGSAWMILLYVVVASVVLFLGWWGVYQARNRLGLSKLTPEKSRSFFGVTLFGLLILLGFIGINLHLPEAAQGTLSYKFAGMALAALATGLGVILGFIFALPRTL